MHARSDLGSEREIEREKENEKERATERERESRKGGKGGECRGLGGGETDNERWRRRDR